jgi:FkbM family methyltransferase
MPSHTVRKLAFDTFASMVRHRRSIADIDGMRFELDLSETIDLSLYLRQYEPEVNAAIRQYTRRGSTVFDVGANIGAHTLQFAKLAGADGRVIAFEPTDYAFAKLTRNLALNDMPQVEPVQLALSDRREGPRRVDFRSSWMTDGGRKDGASTVRFETLDDWCFDQGIGAIDLMKVDIDGNEFPFILGGRKTIARCKPLLLLEAVGIHFDDDARNPYLQLREMGYRFRELRGGRATTVEEMRDRLPRNDVAMSVSLNVLAYAAD